MTDILTKPRKRKKGTRYAEKLPAPPNTLPRHDHTDGRWYSDCPACIFEAIVVVASSFQCKASR